MSIITSSKSIGSLDLKIVGEMISSLGLKTSGAVVVTLRARVSYWNIG